MALDAVGLGVQETRRWASPGFQTAQSQADLPQGPQTTEKVSPEGPREPRGSQDAGWPGRADMSQAAEWRKGGPGGGSGGCGPGWGWTEAAGGGKASLSVPEQGDWSQDPHGGAKGSPAAESPSISSTALHIPQIRRHTLLAPLAPPS